MARFRGLDGVARLAGRIVDLAKNARKDGSYLCGWCKWRGTKIWEQATDDGRYCCWLCGQEVREK